MPELPEVETVRAGLARHVPGRVISAVEVLHPRTVRRHVAGAEDFSDRLVGQTVGSPRRRGKFLWLPLSDDAGSPPSTHGSAAAGSSGCLVAHLGMSGQLLLADASTPVQTHLRVRVQFSDGDPELRFVDQRTFGSLLADQLVPAADAERDTVPSSVAHIARDPLDAAFDPQLFTRLLRRSRRELKPALLDQRLVSGIGNIYADETLWRARLSGRRRTDTLRPVDVSAMIRHAQAVLMEALAAGGTSFDRLYVSAAGTPGWFAQALAVYGRAGRPCPRCGSAISRTRFANRSSFSCPRCQRPPRTARPRLDPAACGSRPS